MDFTWRVIGKAFKVFFKWRLLKWSGFSVLNITLAAVWRRKNWAGACVQLLGKESGRHCSEWPAWETVGLPAQGFNWSPQWSWVMITKLKCTWYIPFKIAGKCVIDFNKISMVKRELCSAICKISIQNDSALKEIYF